MLGELADLLAEAQAPVALEQDRIMTVVRTPRTDAARSSARIVAPVAHDASPMPATEQRLEKIEKLLGRLWKFEQFRGDRQE